MVKGTLVGKGGSGLGLGRCWVTRPPRGPGFRSTEPEMAPLVRSGGQVSLHTLSEGLNVSERREFVHSMDS